MSFPAWDSPTSVSEIHQALEGAAIFFFVALVVLDVIAHFETPHHKLFERIGLVCFGIAVLMEIFAYPYGKRNDELSAKEIARLNREAERFMNLASDADLKRVQLQARLVKIFGPRDLSQEQLRRITSRLVKFAGVQVDVYGLNVGNPYNKSESEESVRIAGQLTGALAAARMDAVGWTLQSCSNTFASNVVVSIREDGPRDTRIASEIIKALDPEIDTFPEVSPSFLPIECIQRLKVGPAGRKPDAVLAIVIGRKIPSLLSPEILGIEPSK